MPLKPSTLLQQSKKLLVILSLLFYFSFIQSQSSAIDLNKSQLDSSYFGKMKGITYGVIISQDGILDRPAYILEGFDPFNETDYGSVFSHWNKSPLVKTLHNSGYDIITIDFTQNHCDVRKNATYIKEFIKTVNQQKASKLRGLLAGESMGGIIGRVALAELEIEEYDHQLKTYIALDSPFKGANIPVGIQYLLQDIAKLERRVIDKTFEKKTGYQLSQMAKTLNSKAAQQLIRYHIADSSHTHYQDFHNYLDSIGYPQKTRNIAFVNGSNVGNKYPFSAGALYFKLNVGWKPLIKINAECYCSQDFALNQKVSLVKDYNIWHLRNARKTFSHHFNSKTTSYDNAPGAYLKKLDFSTEGIHHFCFVPSVSAIDLKQNIIDSPQGLYYFNTQYRSTKEIIQAKESPFDAIYSNGKNDKHAKIYLIPDLETFIEKEIF